MRQTPTNDDVISTREAAERLGVALRTVQLWVESGVLPAWKTAGGHRRIARGAVEKLLAERQAAISVPARGRAGDGAAPAAVRHDDGRFRLLVVEDEPDLLRLFKLMIEGWGLPIALTTASNGFEALLRIGEQRPDLLVTDLNMPGMDGFRMIRALRAPGGGLADLELVVVTALGAQDIEDRGGLPEGVRVFPKPVPFAELERLVRQRLDRRQAA
jgi:excisionase family DNA binding protein